MNDPALESVAAAVEAGTRLDLAAGLALERTDDLHTLGELATAVRRRWHGRRAYYNVNVHINPTNICKNRCRFCAFRTEPGDPRAYVLSLDDVLQRAGQAAQRGATEVHIVGSVHPDLPYAYYRDLVRVVHEAFPRLHIKAYTAVEIAHLAELAGRSTRQVLAELQSLGLGSLPGGGAEIFHPEVRQKICPTKIDADTWLRIHAEAHQLGLRSNATMLYGHIERPEHRLDHLHRLRELQDRTGGFQAFVPLAFQPKRNEVPASATAGGLLDLKVIATSRLMLDNIPHIKAYWVMLGLKVAQVALAFGADDLDGTVVQEQIGHEAGATSPQELSVAAIRRLIAETGHEPIERDTLYRPVIREGPSWRVGE